MSGIASLLPTTWKWSELGDDLRLVMKRPETPGVYVRRELAERVVSLLQGGTNVLLRGGAGTGKTSLARSLVAMHWESRNESREESRQLQLVEIRPLNAPLILETNVARFIQGCHWVHDLENKLESTLSSVRTAPAILFIENVDQLVGAGSSSADPTADVANLLLPHLDKGLRVLASITPDGESRMRAKNERLLGRFTIVDVPEPAAEEALAIARVCLHGMRHASGERVSAAMMLEGMELSAHYFPGEARLASFLRIARSAYAAERTLAPDALLRATAIELGIDKRFLGVGAPSSRAEMLEALGEDVFGQDEAVREVAEALVRYSAGLTRTGAPLGVFLFAGPSGVGKTSLALATAQLLTGSRDSVVRFDMSEYPDPFSARRLIDDGEGSLVSRLRARRAGVLLLDEIEKASPEVIRVLLQGLGEARLTSESGRTARLDHYVVILTSNVGGRRWALDMPRTKTVSLVLADVAETFPPEFRGRLTRTVVFEPLSPTTARRVVERELANLNQLPGIVRRRLQLVWAGGLAPALSAHAVSRERGARGVQAVVRAAVATPLGEWLLEHDEARDGIVMVAAKSERGSLVSLSIDWVDDAGFYRELAN